MEAKDFESQDRDQDFICQELRLFTPAWIMEARARIPLQAKSLPHLWRKAEGHTEEMPMEASERRCSAHGTKEPSPSSHDMVDLLPSMECPPVDHEYTVILS